MVYFLLAVLSSTLVSIIMRMSEKHIRNNVSMLACNYVVCSALAAFLTGFENLFPRMQGLGFALGLGVINGILYLAGFLMLQWNIRKNGVALPAMFMKLGVLVPTLMAVVFFHESPSLLQIIGIVLAISAILLIQSEKGQSKARSGLGLVLLLMTGGLADGMSKVFEYLGSSALNNQFLFYTFVVALVLCVLVCVVQKQSLAPVDALFGLMIAIPNYFSARFLLLALREIPAVVVYPAFSVGTIVLVTLIGAAVFKERLSRRQLAALSIILFALAFLNL